MGKTGSGSGSSAKEKEKSDRDKQKEKERLAKEKSDKERRDKRSESRVGGPARNDNDGLSAAVAAGETVAASMSLNKTTKKSGSKETVTDTATSVGSPPRATRRGTASPSPAPAPRRRRIASDDSTSGDSDADRAVSDDEEIVTGSQDLAKKKLMKRARIEVDHLDDHDSLVFFI